MNFVLNKQTGTFILKEDILDAISMQAKSNASINAAITADASKAKKDYNEAIKRLNSEIYKITFSNFKEDNRIDPEIVSNYLYGEKNKVIPNESQINKFINLLNDDYQHNDEQKQRFPFFALENYKDYVPQIKKDIFTVVNYVTIQQQKAKNQPIFKARDNIETTFFGSKANSYLYDQKNIIPFLVLLAKKIGLTKYPENLIKIASNLENIDINEQQIQNEKEKFLKNNKVIYLINAVKKMNITTIPEDIETVLKNPKENVAQTPIELARNNKPKKNPSQTNIDKQKQQKRKNILKKQNIKNNMPNTNDLDRQNFIKGTHLDRASLLESKILKEYREEINNLLIPHMQKQLGFNHPPTINFAEDSENAQDMFGKTAYYNPSTSEITVYVTNRHPKDIMRSVAHEVIHHAQNQRGEFENSFNLGEEGYAQNNSHLRSMEEEAYLSGNMIFRDWEDNFKKQRNQNKMINESSLRAKIRSMIIEEMNEEEHSADCDCEECANKRKVLKAKGNLNLQGLSEQVEKELVPLKEWRNMELNSLLLNRFGIVSPQVLGEKTMTPKEKELAAKYPPEDKITRGDVITAAKEKGGKSAKKPAKKGKVPPQFLKKEK